MAFAQDNDPWVGTWVWTSSEGGKSFIKVNKYENKYLLKKKYVYSDGKTSYDDITVTFSSPTQITYYEYKEEWNDEKNIWEYWKFFYDFIFEKGRAGEYYKRAEYEYKYPNGKIDRGDIIVNRKPEYYYKDDPDW